MLKGMGAMMGLPMLEAMGPASLASAGTTVSSAAKPPVRLGVIFMPNGVNGQEWLPRGEGSQFELSPTLQPLSKLRDQILVLTNLWNAAANTGDGHYVKVAGLLTGTTITRTTGNHLCSGGISMDQVAAQRIGHMTPLPSLELGIEPVSTGVDTNVGFTRLYGSHIAWNTPTTPLTKEINPQAAFDRLFRADRFKRQEDGIATRSVLDLVREDAKRLRAKVGIDDQRKLDEYFDSVRAVEKRIEFDASRQKRNVLSDPLAEKAIQSLRSRINDYYADPAQVSQRRGNHTNHVRLMLDIMFLAFWTDSTRISSFMFGNAVSGRSFSFLDGVEGGHHQISHHENKEDKLTQYARINQWHVEQLAYLLERLHSTPEGQGTLLDNSMILFASGFRDGNRHDPHNLPLILAGRAGGTINPGRHLVYERNTPLCNLYTSMLNRMGTPVDDFADSTGELSNLQA